MLINPNQLNRPAFSVYLATSQSINATTATRISHDVIVYDTNNFWSTTNFRYQPTIPGKYLFTGTVTVNSDDNQKYCISFIVRNGISGGAAPSNDNTRWSITYNGSGAAGQIVSTCTAIFSLNGTSDFVEHIVQHNSAAARSIDNNAYSTYFTGSWVAP